MRRPLSDSRGQGRHGGGAGAACCWAITPGLPTSLPLCDKKQEQLQISSAVPAVLPRGRRRGKMRDRFPIAPCLELSESP
jgi:hypothetical protein